MKKEVSNDGLAINSTLRNEVKSYLLNIMKDLSIDERDKASRCARVLTTLKEREMIDEYKVSVSYPTDGSVNATKKRKKDKLHVSYKWLLGHESLTVNV